MSMGSAVTVNEMLIQKSDERKIGIDTGIFFGFV